MSNTSAIMFLMDGYKIDHRRQYPPGTTEVYSNFTPRSSRTGEDKIVFFGLQAFLDRWMGEEFKKFFETPKAVVVAEYEEMLASYLGPDNNVGSDHIAALHDLGYVPLEFRAVPEGMRVPLGVPVLTVRNTHPDFFWLTNYFETLISSELWLSCTSATTAYRYRTLFDEAAMKSGAPLEMVPFQGHDFSMRGMEGVDAAMRSGAAHLLSFAGTDTVPALNYIHKHYGDGLPSDYLIGGSVPATEHSVMMAGSREGELETLRRLIALYPSGVLSVVSDTWDLWKLLTEYLPALHDDIMARTNGPLVIRPDSGVPEDILCGDPSEPEGSPANKGVIQLLWEEFGGTVNEAGYKVLDPHVGTIYGDSITLERAEAILRRLDEMGFVSTSVVMGIGSFTYQYVTRDTYGFAMKATSVVVNGERLAIFKDPITDKGDKKSARGLLAVRQDDHGNLILYQDQSENGMRHSMLQRTWLNGNFERRENFAKIRERLGVQP